jgi:hypothetical protein
VDLDDARDGSLELGIDLVQSQAFKACRAYLLLSLFFVAARAIIARG